MAKLSAAERSSATVVAEVLDRVFAGKTDDYRRSRLQFLADSIEYVSGIANDRWGVTLWDELIRFNVGWVNNIVLTATEFLVLVNSETIPPGTPTSVGGYANAPGCDFVDWASSFSIDDPHALHRSHHSAMAISAQRPASWDIRNAHSPGIVAYLNAA